VPYIIDFTTKLDGNAAFYTGTGSTQLVPYVFPVAVNGRPYPLDTKSNQFTRQFDARVRDSVDQSTEPGEAAINPQGLWRRSQSSWHYGAGQEYADTADAEAYRFHTSKGVDPWTKGRLSLLRDTTNVYPTSGTNLYAVTADGRLYGTDGQTVRYTTDFVTVTTVTGTQASALYSITSDGYNVFYSYANGDIDQTNAGISTSSAYITGIEAGVLAYVRGRLMVAGQGVDKRKIWNITTAAGSSANNPSALYTHPNTNWTWVGFAAGQTHIYAAGYAGNTSIIYKTQIRADGTALDIPTAAAELPLGEIVRSIYGYLGYIILGTSTGFRFCSTDADGNLTVGPLVETGSAVGAMAGIGKYVYFSWSNFDSTSTGIGRMDISVFISPNQPAYATDLMATAQGTVQSIHEYNNDILFTVSGVGVFTPHATNLVSSGYVDSGIYRWGVPDAKFIPKWDMRTQPLNGTITLAVASDSGEYETVGTQTTVGSLESTLDGFETKVYEASAKITLARSATDSSLGPVLTRWMGRAYAAPLRSQIFSVPLLLHHKVNVRGSDYYFDVDDELVRLRDLVENPRVVTYQENTDTYSVVVEDVRWIPVDSAHSHNEWDWDGTCVIIMRSVR
jgi:hypothetical protein